MTASPKHIFCNTGTTSNETPLPGSADYLCLEYRESLEVEPNVKISLPSFVSHINYLPDRVLDLLELASYIFCSDRHIHRGEINAMEYLSWSRKLHFLMPVRDYKFWNSESVKRALVEVLKFMSGDAHYEFDFISGHSTWPTGLFDKDEFKIETDKETKVALFSGGLDSSSGAIELLQSTQGQICLVTHRSQNRSARTQKAVVDFIARNFPQRVKHYNFHCTLRGQRAREETQRTRSFLYSSIAYALSYAYSQDHFYIFENGVTSFNFPKRQDLFNARASRTTHPKTLSLLSSFFSLVAEDEFSIKTPFLWKTKSEIFRLIADCGFREIIPSTVSCSKTFQNLGDATHCGGCSQCIDRRFAAYGAELDDVDESGIYNNDFIQRKTEDMSTKTAILDYIRQAVDFATWNFGHFHDQRINELIEITDFISGNDELEKVEQIWMLCKRHGEQVRKAIDRIIELYNDPFAQLPKGSLIDLVHKREYLKPAVEDLVVRICARLESGIPIAFQHNAPKNENDFNDKVSSILNAESEEYKREHPGIEFALAKAIPDHSKYENGLLIESKYIRGSTSPSKVSEGIAADITKYPDDSFLLFVVYDPGRAIARDDKFISDVESKKKKRCKVCIIR